MPIEAPADTSGTRTPYGPVAVVSPTPDPNDATAVGYVSVPMQVYRSKTASTAETDLQTSGGTPITSVTPDSATGACEWLGPVGYAGVLWLADPATGRRWPVHPSDYAGPTTGGGSSVTWDTLTGRPFVVAAGDTPQAARDAISAVTLSQVTKAQVGLGNVNNTADIDKPVSTAQAQAIQTAINTLNQQLRNYIDTKPAQQFSNFDPAVRAIVVDEVGGGSTPAPGVPGPVTSLAVTASTTGDPATLTGTWAAPTSNGGSAITGYKVYRTNPDQTPVTVSASTFTATLTNFVVGQSYGYGVSAFNANGDGPITWQYNLIPSGTTAPPPSNKPGYPSSVVVTQGANDVNGKPTINETWGPPTSDGGSAVTGYYGYRTVPGAANYKTGLLGPTTRSFAFTNFDFNVSYDIGVSAVNANGEGPVFWKTGFVPTTGTVTPPPPSTTTGSLSTGSGIAALWYFGFQRPWLGELPADVKNIYNHYIIGIGQSGGAGTGNISWSPGNNGQSVTAFQADVAAIHARGATICLGIGGSSDGGITITNATNETQAYNSLKGMIDTYSLDGIDIDLEPSGGSWTVASVINVCNRLVANYGPDFIIGVTAGLYGEYTAKWLSLAQGLGSKMTYMAPMLYDFVEAGDSRLNGVTVQKIDAMAAGGVPRSKMIMGYMTRPPAGYTNASPPSVALAAIQYANSQRPGIRGTFEWESWIEGQNGYTAARSFGSWVRNNIKV